MNDTIAVITLDTTQKRIKEVTVAQKQLRFKCIRCATLCCKLGGPTLTKKDAEQIMQRGYSVEEFLEPTKNDDAPNAVGNLKSNKDGSCIFLKFDTEQHRHKCSIYAFRPTLCKTYPFKFEKLGSNKVAVKIIPCCRGLNNPEGKTLDKNFVADNLLEPLLEAINLL